MKIKKHTVAVVGVLLALSLSACNGKPAQPITKVDDNQASKKPTQLEGFKPAAGSVGIMGSEDAGSVAGITLEVREIRDSKRAAVRGIRVQISEALYSREGVAFIDADEIPELIKGIDVILAVKTNPTPFKSFEVQYTTRGALELIAFNDSKGVLSYSVKAGGISQASNFIDNANMQKLRALFVVAQEKLNTPALPRVNG